MFSMTPGQNYGGKASYAKKQGKRSKKDRKQHQTADQRLSQLLAEARQLRQEAQQHLNEAAAANREAQQDLASVANLNAVGRIAAGEAQARAKAFRSTTTAGFVNLTLHVSDNSRATGAVGIILFALHEQRSQYYANLVQELIDGDHVNAGASLEDLHTIDGLLLDIGINLASELGKAGRRANLLAEGSGQTLEQFKADDDQRLENLINYVQSNAL